MKIENVSFVLWNEFENELNTMVRIYVSISTGAIRLHTYGKIDCRPHQGPPGYIPVARSTVLWDTIPRVIGQSFPLCRKYIYRSHRGPLVYMTVVRSIGIPVYMSISTGAISSIWRWQGRREFRYVVFVRSSRGAMCSLIEFYEIYSFVIVPYDGTNENYMFQYMLIAKVLKWVRFRNGIYVEYMLCYVKEIYISPLFAIVMKIKLNHDKTTFIVFLTE